MSFGKKLRVLRKQKGFKQVEIAEMLGIRQNTYSDYENDKTQPNIEAIIEISKILEVPVDVLFFDDFSNVSSSIMKAVTAYLNDRDRLLTKIKKFHEYPSDELRHDIDEVLHMLDFWLEQFINDKEAIIDSLRNNVN